MIGGLAAAKSAVLHCRAWIGLPVGGTVLSSWRLCWIAVLVLIVVGSYPGLVSLRYLMIALALLSNKSPATKKHAVAHLGYPNTFDLRFEKSLKNIACKPKKLAQLEKICTDGVTIFYISV